jgi:hypothetical protein
MARAPKNKVEQRGRRPELRVKVDANYARTLTLAAHERLLAGVMPAVLEHIEQLAARGQSRDVVIVTQRGFLDHDIKALLMTLRGKLQELGFTVLPILHEEEKLGRYESAPALEVTWL